MTHTYRYQAQRGVTLVEASIALACFGLLMILIIAMVQRQDAQSRMVIQDSAVHRAQAAIAAYAAMHSRLPCPADNADLASGGTENCAVTEGYVPVKTLGLPLASAAQMRYRVVAPQLQQVNSTDAQVLQTSGVDLLKTMSPVALKSFVADANAVGVREQNFCETLAKLAVDTNLAAQTAYSLLPEADAQQEDKALHTSGSTLWAALNCTQVRAYALRANANVVASMEFLTQNYNDRLKVWGAEGVNYALDATASVSWVAQATEKIYRQLGNSMAALGVVTCPYCAPSGAALVPAAAVAPATIVAQTALIADMVKYQGQAAAYTAHMLVATGAGAAFNVVTATTTADYKTSLKSGARY